MTDLDILREETGAKGRYVISMNGDVAELTWSRASPVMVIADHTSVPDSFRGSGAGRALVERLVADARAGGFKVVPHCPFVKGLRQRHPEWSDVFA